MKKLFVVCLFFLFPCIAFAQQPKFEPYMITEKDQHALNEILGDIPAKYAIPLINKLMQLEQQAQKSAEKKEPAEPKK